MNIKIKKGDIIEFSLKQEKPFTGKVKVIKLFKQYIETDEYPFFVFLDEITKIN